MCNHHIVKDLSIWDEGRLSFAYAFIQDRFQSISKDFRNDFVEYTTKTDRPIVLQTGWVQGREERERAK